MMHIMPSLRKRRDELREMQLAAKQFEMEVFVKATEKKWITVDPTGPDHSLKYRLVWLVVSKIVHASLNGHK